MIYQYGTESETVMVAGETISAHCLYPAREAASQVRLLITNNLALCNHSWQEGCLFCIYVLLKTACVMSDD